MDSDSELEVETHEHLVNGVGVEFEKRELHVLFDNGAFDGVAVVLFETLEAMGWTAPTPEQYAEALKRRGLQDEPIDSPIQPQEVKEVSERAIRIWKNWALDELENGAGESMHDPGRREMLAAIFDMAIVGAGLVKQERVNYKQTLIKQLRQMADSYEQGLMEIR